jgi:hypothetical protein
MGLTINLPGTINAEHLVAVIPLAIKVAACPNNANKPIPRKKMVTEEKLKAEGGLAGTTVILGWHFNFRTLTITLSKHKYIEWLQEIQQMMTTRREDKEAAGVKDRTHGTHWLCHPLGISLLEPPEIVTRMSLE